MIREISGGEKDSQGYKTVFEYSSSDGKLLQGSMGFNVEDLTGVTFPFCPGDFATVLKELLENLRNQNSATKNVKDLNLFSDSKKAACYLGEDGAVRCALVEEAEEKADNGGERAISPAAAVFAGGSAAGLFLLLFLVQRRRKKNKENSLEVS